MVPGRVGVGGDGPAALAPWGHLQPAQRASGRPAGARLQMVSAFAAAGSAGRVGWVCAAGWDPSSLRAPGSPGGRGASGWTPRVPGPWGCAAGGGAGETGGLIPATRLQAPEQNMLNCPPPYGAREGIAGTCLRPPPHPGHFPSTVSARTEVLGAWERGLWKGASRRASWRRWCLISVRIRPTETERGSLRGGNLKGSKMGTAAACLGTVMGCQVEQGGETRVRSRVEQSGGGGSPSSPGAEVGGWGVLRGPLIQQLQPHRRDLVAGDPSGLGPCACKSPQQGDAGYSRGSTALLYPASSRGPTRVSVRPPGGLEPSRVASGSLATALHAVWTPPRW